MPILLQVEHSITHSAALQAPGSMMHTLPLVELVELDVLEVLDVVEVVELDVVEVVEELEVVEVVEELEVVEVVEELEVVVLDVLLLDEEVVPGAPVDVVDDPPVLAGAPPALVPPPVAAGVPVVLDGAPPWPVPEPSPPPRPSSALPCAQLAAARPTTSSGTASARVRMVASSVAGIAPRGNAVGGASGGPRRG